MIFTHTSKERGLWRGWLKNGQSLELSVSRKEWEFGLGVLIHSNDADLGDRMLCLKFWRYAAYVPLGVIRREYTAGDEPQWSAFGSSEFGLWFHWGRRSKHYELPGSVFTVSYEHQMPDGTWRSVFDRTAEPYAETHPYTYQLRSGEVQERIATVSKRRHVLNRRGLRLIGWPSWIRESIDVSFSDEVGEASGTWKGGCIGCGYDLRPGETMEQSLRRMERERKF